MAAPRLKWSFPGNPAWLLVILLVFTGGPAFLIVRSRLEAQQAAESEAVESLPRQVKVAALGRVEPAGRIIEVVPSENGRLKQLLVEESDQVKANQVIAYLDLYDVREAERNYAASQLAEAQALLQAQTQTGQANIQEAQSRIEQIDAPQLAAIQAQEKTIDSLEAELEIAEADLARFEVLLADGAVSQQERDRQRSTVKKLQEDILSAEARKRELTETRRSGMSNAAARVDVQVANLQLSQVQAQVESAAQNLALAEARLDQTVIRAPSDGQILRVEARPGEAVSTTSPIVTLGNTEQMYVVAEVYETDVTQVKQGQPATITSRNGSFDQALTGTVEQVGLQIFKNDVLDDDPAANADARVVEVRIRMDQSEVIAGLTNLQVDVAIDVES